MQSDKFNTGGSAKTSASATARILSRRAAEHQARAQSDYPPPRPPQRQSATNDTSTAPPAPMQMTRQETTVESATHPFFPLVSGRLSHGTSRRTAHTVLAGRDRAAAICSASEPQHNAQQSEPEGSAAVELPRTWSLPSTMAWQPAASWEPEFE